jgi:outer membrane autotransporter protein
MPQAAMQGLHFTQMGFTETGTTGAELAVASRTRDALRSVIGISAARRVTTNSDVVLTPQATLGWSHEFLDPTSRINASFASGGPLFAVYGAAPGRDALLAGIALSAQVGRASLFVSYGVSLATNDAEQTGAVGLKVTW